MKEVFNDYLNDKIELEPWQKVGITCLIVIISGFIGWIYEFIFYYFNFGMKKFYYQGGNFTPWINIYAIGAIMIIILTKKFKKKPALVFLISGISTCILEYFSGLAIYKIRGGLRLWNYNTEILNFGNIGGFVCFRSFIGFGLSALLLMYILLPTCIYITKKSKKKPFLIITVGLCSIILIDELYNLIFARVLHLPRARNIYKKLGFNYMNYWK